MTSAGKITAKVLLAGVTYTFSGSAGFDELLDRDEELAGVTRHMRVELSTTVKAVKNKKTTAYKDNILTITLPDGALTNSVALAEAVGSAALSLNVLNAAKTAVTEDVAYKANSTATTVLRKRARRRPGPSQGTTRWRLRRTGCRRRTAYRPATDISR